MCAGGPGSILEADNLDSECLPSGVSKISSSHYVVDDCYRRLQIQSVRPLDGLVWLVLPAEHTTACGSLMVSWGALEVTLVGYLRPFRNVRL